MANFITLNQLKQAVQSLLIKINDRFDSIVIPSKTSDLDNDSGFITNSSIPTNVSDLTNDAGYLTEQEQSDWEEDDSTSSAYIVNRPAIRAGEGQSSIIEGQLAAGTGANVKICSLVINGEANVTTYSYTTQDTLPGSATSRLRGYVYYAAGSSAFYKYAKITEIDTTNQKITLSNSLSYNSAIVDGALVLVTVQPNVAAGAKSHAEGQNTLATGGGSHAEGAGTLASGSNSHAEGSSTFASGSAAHAEGSSTRASGAHSHAEGSDTRASGADSHAEGTGQVSGDYKISGQANATTYTVADYYNYYNTGQQIRYGTNSNTATITSVSRKNKTITVDKTLDSENAISNGSIVIVGKAQNGHTEGIGTTTLYSAAHAQGNATVASEQAAHAEGIGSHAFGKGGHAEGIRTQAHQRGAHGEGQYSQAQGTASHAEGYNTYAVGQNSHSEGEQTIAQRKDQHVFGKFNVKEDGDNWVLGTYVEIVGNGASDASRSNARTLDWNGNEVIAGKLTVGADPVNNMDVATKQYVDTSLANVPSTDTTYTISMSSNRITLTPSSGTATYVDLPVYNGGVTDVWQGGNY